LKAINSPSVRASIDRAIIGDQKDLDRRLFEDQTYYEILEILYSKKFRKYWINGILIA